MTASACISAPKRKVIFFSIMNLLIVIIGTALTGCQPRLATIQQTSTIKADTLNTVEINPLETISPPAKAIDDQRTALMPHAQESISELFNAPKYNIKLIIDKDASPYTGNMRLKYTNIEEIALDELYFRLLPNDGGAYGNGSLTVSEVKVEGVPVNQELSLNDSVLKIDLPEEILPGESLKVEMQFIGQVPGNIQEENVTTGYGIYNLSRQALTLSAWYPMLAVYDEDGWNLDPASEIGDSVYSDIGFFTVTVSIPNEFQIIATGSETSRTGSDQGNIVTFVSGPVREFTLVMGKEFSKETRIVDGVAVSVYTLPEHSSASELTLDITADSLHTYSQVIAAYPYQELDLVEIPMRYASGVEFPGMILINKTKFDRTGSLSFPVVIAHEVAHQWWYNMVGNDVFDDPWMDEALTTYTSSLMFEFTSGDSAAEGLRNYWQKDYQRTVEDNHDARVTESLAYFEMPENTGMYGGIVYSKGALFFENLRKEIGDQAFFDGLRNYFQSYQYRIAKPDDLLEAFETSAGKALDDFYQIWLYSP